MIRAPIRAMLLLFWLVVSASGRPVAGQAGSSADSIEVTKTLGPVTVTVSLSPQRPTIGDVLELEIHVMAKRDVEVLMPEFGEALSRFQVMDFSPQEKLNDAGDSVFVQKYKLQSPPSGTHAIPPILIEFIDQRDGKRAAPAGMDAYELFTERINFEVQSVLVNNTSQDLNPPLGRIEPPAENQDQSLSNWVYLLIGVIALGGGAGFVFFLTRFRNRTLRKSAYEIAKRQLDQLTNRPLPDPEEIDQFYVGITTIIRKYLENRFDLRAPELTTEEFLSTVSDSAELTSDHNLLLNNFLRHADLVKFAGVTPSEADVQGMIDKAKRFLEETRQNSPIIEDPEAGRPPSAATNPQEDPHV